MSPERPLASLSLDADDLWSYLKTHGNPSWETRPSYLAAFFPRVLDLLDEAGVRITFFLVGFDAAREQNRPALAAIGPRGHGVGNHSFLHDCWLHRYTRAQLNDELARSEEAIAAATGIRPRGFRGPGFSWSPLLLDVLERRGYHFDASTLPTFIGPLARRYFLATARLTEGELRQRGALFGGFRDGFRPNTPYEWDLGGGRTLLEMPVTTMPVTRLPFHLSYLLYLSRISEGMMLAYLRTAVGACRLFNVEPSFLLHPLDVLGGEEVPQLRFFPGMDLSSRQKAALFVRALGVLREAFTLVPMDTHATAILARQRLRRVAPRLAFAAGTLSEQELSR